MRFIGSAILFLLRCSCPGPDRPPAVTDGGGSRVDAGTDGGTAEDGGVGSCTFGADQTCNDNAAVSALWGSCGADGTCSCHSGFEVNPNTGRCRLVSAPACGDASCSETEFCVERVHVRDGGPLSTWMCMRYFQCTTTDCACALASFISQSCVSPTCSREGPDVQLRCDDLN
jgi:hypothetical protein